MTPVPKYEKGISRELGLGSTRGLQRNHCNHAKATFVLTAVFLSEYQFMFHKGFDLNRLNT